MRRWMLIVAVCGALAVPVAARAQEGFGLGVIAGEPTGLSAKLWLDRTHAVAMAAAWSLGEHHSFRFHGDYLFHRFDLLRPAVSGSFPVYFGVGGRLKIQDRDNKDLVGARFPVGVAYHFPRAPVDLFAEIVPALDLLPETRLDLDAAIGARYYFR